LVPLPSVRGRRKRPSEKAFPLEAACGAAPEEKSEGIDAHDVGSPDADGAEEAICECPGRGGDPEPHDDGGAACWSAWP
jgi:hypothetical protein